MVIGLQKKLNINNTSKYCVRSICEREREPDDITTRDEITAVEIFTRLRIDMLKAIFVNM